MAVKDLLNYFYSHGRRVPQGLFEIDPSIVSIGPDFQASDAEYSGLVWFHLTAGMTIAAQTEKLRAAWPKAKLVIMSDLPNDLEALAAFSILAKAYCNTHAAADVLRNVSVVVNQGGIWIGESIMSRLLALQVPQAQIEQKVSARWDDVLTLREKEVAVLVADGLQNRQIAEQMAITERTVKAHIGSILEKLQLKSRLQLALLVKES